MFLSSLIWRGISEFLLVQQDIDRFRGHKAVLAIMSCDRNHPEFRKAQQNFASLEEADDLVLVAEDHPNGPLHDRFHPGTAGDGACLIKSWESPRGCAGSYRYEGRSRFLKQVQGHFAFFGEIARGGDPPHGCTHLPKAAPGLAHPQHYR